MKARRAQSDLNAYQATHDELTGLPNRGLFSTLLESALTQARESDGTVAVVLLDLDRFKDINDTLGHRYGDYLLQQIGPRISAVLRDVDVLASWAVTSSCCCSRPRRPVRKRSMPRWI